jgi:hypothetical protein
MKSLILYIPSRCVYNIPSKRKKPQSKALDALDCGFSFYLVYYTKSFLKPKSRSTSADENSHSEVIAAKIIHFEWMVTVYGFKLA